MCFFKFQSCFFFVGRIQIRWLEQNWLNFHEDIFQRALIYLMPTLTSGPDLLAVVDQLQQRRDRAKTMESRILRKDIETNGNVEKVGTSLQWCLW